MTNGGIRLPKLITRAGVFAITCLTVAAVWAAPPEASWPGHDGPLQDVAFSPDGKLLATLGEDGKLKLFEAATQKPLAVADECLSPDNNVRFTADGKTAMALARGDTLVCVGSDGRTVRRLPLHTPRDTPTALEVSPDGKTLAVVGRGSLRLLSVADATERKSWVVHENYGVRAVAFSPDGKLVATTATDHKALVLDPETGKIIWECPLPLNGVAVAFARDGRTLFAADTGGVVMAFDLATGTGKTLCDGLVRVRRLAASPDGKWLYLGGTGKQPVRLALPDGKFDDATIAAGGVWNKALAVSPDGNWLAGGANDGTLQLWKKPAD